MTDELSHENSSIGAGEDLLITDSDNVRTLTLNRPARRNALSVRLRHQLAEAVLSAADDDSVWVLVLTGAGGLAFCSGVDLKEVNSVDQSGGAPFTRSSTAQRNVCEFVYEFPKPTIASINGAALGAGFDLALACDLRIASRTAQLGSVEAKRGMGATFSAVVLPRVVRPAVAFEMLYTAEAISATKAEACGLVNRVAEPGELARETASLARQIAANAPISLRRIKETVVKGATLPVSAAIRLEVGPNPYLSEDRVEGVAAYLEKRAPQWRNR
jgi:enoyl-CoA hydratase